MHDDTHESLIKESVDPLIGALNKVVIICVKVMACLMTLVIIWGVLDVIAHLYAQIHPSEFIKFDVESLLATFGTFLAVLIAIEIFLNIVFYLKQDAIHVPLVLATALTAVSRKVIILDYQGADAYVLLAMAAIILALGGTYWLVTKDSTPH